MTDKDIAKLVSQLKDSLATKEDINRLDDKIDKGIQGLDAKIDKDIKRLEKKIDKLDSKTNTILEFAEAIDETTMDLEKRLKKIESIPAIAHQIKK